MVSKSREVGIRLSVKDDAIVRRALQELGKDGEAALKRIERAGKPASTSLVALNAAAGAVRGSIGGMMAGFVAGLVPVLTLSAAINGTRAALEKYGDIADKSKSAGLDSEFFQGLAYQAKLAGVDIGTLSGALDTFNKNAGQAAEGRGRMVSALKGENAELLRNIQLATSQEERLRLVFDALSKIGDANKKAALAAAVFGEAGTDLVAAFEGGSIAIDETIRKARELGIIVDRETIARADELGDKFDTVSEIIDNKLKTALVNLGPTLVWVLELLNSIIKLTGDALRGVGDFMAEGDAQVSTQGLKDEFATLDKLYATAHAKVMTLTGERQDALGNQMQNWQDRMNAIQVELDRRGPAVGVSSTPPGSPPSLPLNDEAKQAIKEAEALVKRLRTETETYADTLADLQQKLDGGLITQETFNRGQAEAALKFAKAADDADEYAAALGRIEEAHREGLITEQQYTDAVESLTKKRLTAQNDWAAGIQLGLMQIKDGAKDVATDVASAVTGWADQLGDQIGKAAQTGKFAWQDVVKSILADTAKLATQQLISRPLAGFLGSVAGSLLGGGGYLGNSIGPGASFGQLSAFRVGNNADGTDNWRGGPTWVGERGPEILNLPRGSQVIPNHKIGGTSVTLAPTYQIDGSGLSEAQLLRVMEANNAALLAQVPGAVKKAVADGVFG